MSENTKTKTNKNNEFINSNENKKKLYKAETLRKMEIKINSPDFMYDCKNLYIIANVGKRNESSINLNSVYSGKK